MELVENKVSEKPEISTKQVSKVYDIYSSLYDIVFGANLNQGRKRAIEMMDLQLSESILEIGIGTGISLKSYNRCQEITGIDLSEKMIAKAKNRVQEYGHEKTKLLVGDAENLPCDSESFDKVVIMYVYSVTPNPLKLIEEAKRVCTNNGDIYMVNHFSNYDDSQLTLSEKILRKYTAKIGFRSDFPYQKYVTEQNLNIQKIESVNFMGLSRVIHFKK
jgi:phosphatidylethanolamine/phosphatidyl-N-methylethanolamine N-methyltransferase